MPPLGQTSNPSTGPAAAIAVPVGLLVFLSGIGPFAMISVVPLIPQMGTSFGISYGMAQSALSVYFAFFAVAQLVLGPISDRIGRRPVMIGAVGLFVLGSVASAAAAEFWMVLGGRGLQAFGAAAGVVVTRAIMFDVYGREKSASLIGYLTMAMVIGPMFAPTIAGLFATHLGWQYLFWFHFVAGLLAMLWLVRGLPETRWLGEAADAPPQGFFDGVPLLKHPVFLSYAINWAFGVGIYYAFLAGAAYIVVEQMGRSEAEYGMYFIVAALCYMAGSFISARYAMHLGLLRFIKIGTLLALCAALGQWFVQDLPHPIYVFAPMMGVALANGFVTPNAVASAMAVVPRLAGAASGLAGFLQISLGAVVTLLVGFMQNEFDFAMALVMSVCSILATLVLVVGRFQPDK